MFVASTVFIRFFLQKKDQTRIHCLAQQITTNKQKLLAQTEAVIEQQQELTAQQSTHQALCAFYRDILDRQQERFAFIHKSNNVVYQALSGKVHIDPEECAGILNNCLQQTKSLFANLFIVPQKISINKLLDAAEIIFADKIYKNQLEIKISNLSDMFLIGDIIASKLIIFNIIGKCIYRLPKQGYLTITSEKPDTLCIKDNGFSLSSAQRKLIQSQHAFFLDIEALQQLCHHSGIRYESSESNETVTTIIFPQENVSTTKADNVIQLFS